MRNVRTVIIKLTAERKVVIDKIIEEQKNKCQVSSIRSHFIQFLDKIDAIKRLLVGGRPEWKYFTGKSNKALAELKDAENKIEGDIIDLIKPECKKAFGGVQTRVNKLATVISQMIVELQLTIKKQLASERSVLPLGGLLGH